MAPPAPLEFLYEDADNVVAVWRRLIAVQIRRGRLTTEFAERMVRVLSRIGTAGFAQILMVVLEPTAIPPDEAARAAQKVFLDTVLARPHVRMSATILGDTLTATLNRTVGRMVAMKNPQVLRTSDLDESIEWVVSELEAFGHRVTARELAAMIATVRAHTVRATK